MKAGKSLKCHCDLKANKIIRRLFCISDGEFEPLDVTPLSSPPELPDVMKPQDSPSTHAQEQAAS
jgi:transcription elongation factor B subunit 2